MRAPCQDTAKRALSCFCLLLTQNSPAELHWILKPAYIYLVTHPVLVVTAHAWNLSASALAEYVKYSFTSPNTKIHKPLGNSESLWIRMWAYLENHSLLFFYQLQSGYMQHFLLWIKESQKTLYSCTLNFVCASSSAHISKGMEVGNRKLSTCKHQ